MNLAQYELVLLSRFLFFFLLSSGSEVKYCALFGSVNAGLVQDVQYQHDEKASE